MPVCCGQTWIFQTRIHIYYHDLAFSNSVHFSVILTVIPGVLWPQGLHRILVILFPRYLSIRSFCYVLFIPIFYSKIVLLPLHLIVGMSSCTLYQLVGYSWGVFPTSWAGIFHWSLSDSKSTQIIRILLSILADLNNSVACIVSILLQISNSSSLFSKHSVTVPSSAGVPFYVPQFFQLSSKIQV